MARRSLPVLIHSGLMRQTPGDSGGTAQDLHLIPYSPFAGTC